MIELPFAVIPLSLGTLATGNERAETPAAHLTALKAIAMVWRTNGASNVWIRGDFGSAKDIDFVSLIRANALPGTTIRVRLGTTQAQVDGTAPYDSGALPFISPSITRDDGLYHSHLQLGSVVNARWWRIDIGGHTGDFEAAKLVMGKRVTPTRYYDTGFEFGVEDLGDIEFGRWGVPEETSGLIFRRLAFKLSWLSTVEYETQFRPMVEKLGKRGVVYWCFDPQANAYRQAKTYFGVFRETPFAVASLKPGNYAKEFSIRSFI
jgi:hypothetical protein